MENSRSQSKLARDFGARSELTRCGVRAFCEALIELQPPEFERWRTFSEGLGISNPKRRAAAVDKLAGYYGTDRAAARSDAVLFALQTYYAVLVDLLVGRFRELREVGFAVDEPFSWYADAPLQSVQDVLGRLRSAMARYDLDALPAGTTGGDLFGRLYQELFPRSVRHQLGEYYTPGWLADHVLDQVGYRGDPRRRLLDPSCGSGLFLVKAIERIRAAGGELLREILSGVVGFDLNPLAAMTARANYLIAIRDLLSPGEEVAVPVHLCDSILDGRPGDERFDYVVGNPPWIAWDNLPAAYRRATKPLWERYGLFSLSGNQARHGGGKKDLSMLMLSAVADRNLRDGGRLGLVITQTLFQSKGAGDGFRRFRLGPEGAHLEVLRVDDLVELRPFGDATNFTATISLQKGAPTRYPVPYFKWSAGGDRFRQEEHRAEPIEPGRPGSPWLVQAADMTANPVRPIGPSDYTARLGANSGGANGVYWLELLGRVDGGVRVRNLAGRGKRAVRPIERVVEPELLYPLVRWGDVARFSAAPSAHIILAQDVNTRTGIDPVAMQRDCPRTYAYLEHFADLLRDRAAYRRYQGGRPFYSMYNVGPYTVAPTKVVWRRMDRRINAAVLEEIDDPLLGRRPVVPQETCVLIAADSTDEAHYLCAVLNSAAVDLLVTSHSVIGGKGFGTPSMLDYIGLRRFDPADRRHRALADCSREAHRVVDGASVSSGIQERIDKLSAELPGNGSGPTLMS